MVKYASGTIARQGGKPAFPWKSGVITGTNGPFFARLETKGCGLHPFVYLHNATACKTAAQFPSS